jgi:hypothetical protein
MKLAVIGTLEQQDGRWVFRHSNGIISNQFERGGTREAAVRVLAENGLTVNPSGMVVSLDRR